MRRNLVLTVCLAMAMIPPSPAKAIEYLDIQLSRPDDLQMNCHEISREVSLMEHIIEQARKTQENAALTSTGVGVAKTVASYMVGSLGGALGIMAAGYIVHQATDDREENAMALEDLAEQRRSFMVGIYNARTCMGPLELNSIEPAAGKPTPEPPPRKTRYQYND